MGRGQPLVDELYEEMAAVINAEQPQKDTERAIGDLLDDDSPRRQRFSLTDDGEGAIIHDMLHYSIIRVDSGQDRLTGRNRKRIDRSRTPCYLWTAVRDLARITLRGCTHAFAGYSVTTLSTSRPSSSEEGGPTVGCPTLV